jgi:membrane associated rhomboid family serine protease
MGANAALRQPGAGRCVQLGMKLPVFKLPVIVGLVLAGIVFVVLKLLGLFLKFALIAAVLGFVAGLLLVHMFRRLFRRRSI